MTRINDGLYTDEGEIDRWAIKRSNDAEAAELRLARWEPYPGTVRVTLFADGDEVGESRIGMNLDPEHVEALIADLEDILPLVKGE